MYVVELPHVKKALLSVTGLDENKIKVVNSCIDKLYLDKNEWRKIEYFSNLFNLLYESIKNCHFDILILASFKSLMTRS